MKKLRLTLAAIAVVAAGIVSMTNIAVAQYVLTASDCVPTTQPSWHWWRSNYANNFVPDWEPFFRRHVYRYGPLACSAVIIGPVISSKY
jgi:hypothetical protein